ncbi:MAG TPA: hypothetical protein DF427_01005 [Moraxellaceae bacterium]|nr:hypothetical protein [Moraxellaceae bacterium]
MPAIHDLKDQVNTKTINFVLLTLATIGIYPLLWVWQNSRVIGQVTRQTVVGQAYILWMAALIGWAAALASAPDDDVNAFGGLLNIALAVLYIVWAFKAKKCVEEYALREFRVDPRMNSFYTFVFNIYYINYCINDLPEAERKQRLLSGQSDVSGQS